MTRDWKPKPGDVSAVTREDGTTTRAITSRFGPSFSCVEGSTRPIVAARPLVVIDPEDREAVDGLMRAFEARRGESMFSADDRHMQAALRDLADPKPPKPEELTGLGAVVVDVRGHRWVRIELGAENPWGNADGSGGWVDYADIDAVEVLSQGGDPVTAVRRALPQVAAGIALGAAFTLIVAGYLGWLR